MSQPSGNTRVVLANRPEAEPSTSDFRVEEGPVPELGEGEVLLRTIYVSLDPYMRGRMRDVETYTEPQPLDEVMEGAAVGEVMVSDHDAFDPGDFVLGETGWQEYGVADGDHLTGVSPGFAPLSYYLGILGMPGLTAYVGLLDIGKPDPDETVLVSAASGAVGSVVGQIARIKGCHVVGIVGTDEKCDYITDELGYDEAINRRSADINEALGASCPDGIDVYFDNVGGEILETALWHLNPHARVPLCGLIAEYNEPEPPPGPNLTPVLINRVKVQGFIVRDHADRQPDFVEDVGGWLDEGKMTYREDIVQGIEQAPEAFLGLFDGSNFGKLVVQVSEDPTRD